MNGIDDVNFEKFFEFTDYDNTWNSHRKFYIHYARTQSKKFTLLEDLHLFWILIYHN